MGKIETDSFSSKFFLEKLGKGEIPLDARIYGTSMIAHIILENATEAFDILLEKMKLANLREIEPGRYYSGNVSPLGMAVVYNRKDMAEKLITHQVDLEYQDYNGDTMLMLALPNEWNLSPNGEYDNSILALLIDLYKFSELDFTKRNKEDQTVGNIAFAKHLYGHFMCNNDYGDDEDLAEYFAYGEVIEILEAAGVKCERSPKSSLDIDERFDRRSLYDITLGFTINW